MNVFRAPKWNGAALRDVFNGEGRSDDGWMIVSMSLFITMALATVGAATNPTPLADVLGVTHVDGKYRFTEKDFLNEGVDVE